MQSLVNDVLDSLEDLGYNGVFDEKTIIDVAEAGPSSPKLTKLISSLCSELKLFYDIEEVVNPTSGPGDEESFLFEISGFLSEYGCPYKSLVSGNVTERLSNPNDCLKLILFLTSELQAAKIYYHRNPDKIAKTSQINSASSVIFDLIKRLCIALKMSKPPDNISLDKIFAGIHSKLNQVVKGAPTGCLNKPVIKSQLGPVHWEKLEAINEALIQEYSTRRSMLLKRVDVTIASFNWSDRAKTNMNKIAEVYQKQRHSMNAGSSISLANLLASREDLSQVYKTSSGATRHKCDINKVLMGSVPDRGGRPNETAPPPPEMPSWQKRQDGGGRGGGRGGNRGGRGGNYGHGDNRRQGNDRNGYGGGYQGGNRGGYHSDRGGYDNRPQSGRGGSRWSRGGGGLNQYNDQKGHGYGQGGFASGRQNFAS